MNILGTMYQYEHTKYRKGTSEEINAYLRQVLSENPYSYYFSRKFALFKVLRSL